MMVRAVLAAMALAVAGPALAKKASKPPRWLASISRTLPPQNLALDPERLRNANLLKDAIRAYSRGDLAGGDAVKAKIDNPGGKTAAEWAAIRYALPVGYERIQAFLSDNPQWPMSRLFRNRIERAFLQDDRSPAEIRSFFTKDKPLTGTGLVALGKALQADNQTEQAFALFREAWREQQLGASLEAQILAMKPSPLTAVDHRFRMERQLFQSAWKEAEQSAALAGPDYSTLVSARMAVMRNDKNAATLLAKVPKALQTDSSYLFSQSHFLIQQKKYAEAADTMALAPRDIAILADGDEWWDDRERLTRALLNAGDAKRAYTVASRHGAESPANRVDAEFLSGWISLRFLDNPKQAAIHFASARSIAETPISAARAAYWQGRAAEASGTKEQAADYFRQAADYPIAYYGQLAREKLSLPVATYRPLPAPTNAETRMRIAGMNTVKAMDALRDAGRNDLVLAIGLDIASGLVSVSDLDAFASLCAEKNDTRLVLAIGKQAVQRNIPLDIHAFPIQVIPDFKQEEPAIENAYIYAITRQESAFNQRAQSPVGARGLMQLMPATAQETAKRLKLAYAESKLTDDPIYNATLGAAYLRGLLNEWNGSHVLAFASYNAGSGNVRKWIAANGDPRHPGVDATDWVERIPFSETRNYVQRVLENYRVYQARLASPNRTTALENNRAP